MADFLEERLSVAVRYGAMYGDSYAVKITETENGNEERLLLHPFPKRRFRFEYDAKATTLYQNIANIYHRAYGRYAGFRVKCLDDFTTNAETSAPTALDQTLKLLSAGVYQLQKTYGAGGTPLGIGRPVRYLFKPVTGTTLVGASGAQIISGWSVNTVNGQVTFSTNKTFSITGITKAASAVLTIGSHTITVNESVHISGVSGMTQINGQRATVTATTGTTITVAINSTSYSTYTSGGTVNTRPQAGETVTGGCEFDIPARFDTELEIKHHQIDYRDIANLELVELLNP